MIEVSSIRVSIWSSEVRLNDFWPGVQGLCMGMYGIEYRNIENREVVFRSIYGHIEIYGGKKEWAGSKAASILIQSRNP